MVWGEVENVLRIPEIIIAELEKAKEIQSLEVLQSEIDRINSILDNNRLPVPRFKY